MIIRLFDTTVDPGDVGRATELFRADVAPAFDAFPGCHGIELLVGVDEHSGDLVELCAISRWDSKDAIDAAVDSDDYRRALAEFRKLFQQSPIVRHFTT
ncbi:MAG TPA: antibiotic biosynthesis monooxygenase family protein [Actinomycetota bacterium]|nr:antibiotic biosynthesis monooxygenase family protein [Actinomycetota bacterium]